MRRFAIAGICVVVVLASCGSNALEREWLLGQNDPEPCCPQVQPASIMFALDQQCYVLFEIWNEEMSAVVRTIIAGALDAGLYMVAWDGRDTSGEYALNGEYPYTLTASDAPGGVVLFADTLAMHIDCESPVEEATWGSLKSLYRP